MGRCDERILQEAVEHRCGQKFLFLGVREEVSGDEQIGQKLQPQTVVHLDEVDVCRARLVVENEEVAPRLVHVNAVDLSGDFERRAVSERIRQRRQAARTASEGTLEGDGAELAGRIEFDEAHERLFRRLLDAHEEILVLLRAQEDFILQPRRKQAKDLMQDLAALLFTYVTPASAVLFQPLAKFAQGRMKQHAEVERAKAMRGALRQMQAIACEVLEGTGAE